MCVAGGDKRKNRLATYAFQAEIKEKIASQTCALRAAKNRQSTRKIPALEQGRIFGFAIGLSAFYFVAFEATRADVSGFDLSVFYDFHFLYVRFESSPRLAVAVADVVTRCLALVANTAHSRHISHLHGRNLENGRNRPAQNEHRYYTKMTKKKQSILRLFHQIFVENKKLSGGANFFLAK